MIIIEKAGKKVGWKIKKKEALHSSNVVGKRPGVQCKA